MSITRILVIGDGGVGKTQLINKWVNRPFERKYLSTRGMNVIKHENTIYYDYPGQEVYANHLSRLSERIDKVYYVYDTTSGLSYKRLKMWKKLVGDMYGEVNGTVIGTKTDSVYSKLSIGQCVTNK